ncbi:MAG TPA: arylsulfotransferase family protein [Solirubrobacteraceae bacterium]|nr:arylsulfotransferase family protein [Solirubrobacteraceae bacterium]
MAATLALLAGGASASAATVTVSPLPGTQDASTKTQISFLGAPAGSISKVTVVGQRSGVHRGRLEAYSTGTGASFLLHAPLDQGERVRVTATVGRDHVGTQFTVARWARYQGESGPTAAAPRTSAAPTVQSFVSAPRLQPPSVDVTTDAKGAITGDIFVAPDNGGGRYGPMILGPQGQLVWFDPLPAHTRPMDFRVEQYQGQPDLVWWQGLIADIGVGYGVDEIYNSRYQKVAHVQAGNGYEADLHEIDITPQGTAFITAYSLVHADLSAAGGSRDGTLLEPVVQEIDIKTGLVMLQWDPLGRVLLTDAYTHPLSPGRPWDWFHLNSISLGPGNTALLDSRNTWAAYDVSLSSGQILWRVGGKHSTFKMGPGTEMAYQHDAELQAGNTISVFDDGDYPPVHRQSRVIRLQINWHTLTVNLVDQIVHTNALLSPSQGNDQPLANGDSFVGWGQAGYFSEFSPTGATLFDAHFPGAGQSYRAYVFPWSGTPASPPAVAAKETGRTTDTIYASWNGATSVAGWRVFAGPDSAHLAQVAQVPATGFQTTIPISTTGRAFLVQAVNAAGAVLRTSRTTTD